MAYNPFLSMGEPAGAAGGAEVLNPFMMTDAEPAAFSGDNPFATSNPFSDLGGGFEPAAGDEVPTDVFGADPPVDGARLFDAVPAPLTRAAEELFAPAPPTKPTELALRGEQPSPPGRPLPPETHDLILSVTGQMELASSHLLDRIPPTRTPSPVSARDIHSPSPTPEPDLPHDPPAPDSFDINRNRPLSPAPAPPALTPPPVTPAVPPARPPPARPAAVRPPPPRPAPPPPPPPAAPRAAPPPDDINLFDAPAPPALKPTKEDILSLYSAPKKEERQIDFLSDDILEDLTADGEVMQQNFGSSAPAAPGADVASAGAASLLPGEVSPPHGAAEPMDCSEPPLPEIRSAPAPAPDDRSPFAIATPDMESQRPAHASADVNPFESVGAQETTFSDSTNVFGISPGAEDAFACPGEDAFGGCAADAGGAVLEAGPFGGGDTWGGAGADAGWDGASEAMAQDAFPESQDAFDAFSAKFDSTTANHVNTGAWGDGGPGAAEVAEAEGFEAEAFDPFLSMSAPPPAPAATPRLRSQGSADSTDDTFSVFIRPKAGQGEGEAGLVPALAPPPRPHALPDSPRANPFDSASPPPPLTAHHPAHTEGSRRSSAGSGGTPPTPLFDEDVSQPLEDFPRTKYTGPGWEMHLRQPNKKKITGQRFWKKVWVRVVWAGDNPVVQLSEGAEREPFQELPLQACYSVSDVGAQQFDQFGKIFTVKLQYVFYKERPGVRPGQVTKAERITSKLSQFAAYAIQGDYQGVKEFGSDLRKLGLPVEHAPQVSQLFKLGSLAYEDVKQFSCCVEEALFRLSAHRDRALTYKMEEVQVTAVDELHVEQDAEGSVLRQIARVRLFFLGFLSGMPDVELGVNDLRRQGKEVVGRHDIIPVVTEEWIRVEEAEFHACVQPEEFTKTQIIKFKPPDACYIELMRFRVRPPKNRELPLQLKAVWCVTGNKVELRADVLVPGFASRKLGQVPCEDVAIRFPIPECWIYLFRVEKHFRYGSVKSAHRRTGKIKGIERFLGAVDTLQESLIEVTSGQAKYEHQHRAIVWRMPRLPKEGQGAYTTHNLVCRMALTSYDQVPAELARWAHVEFTMPATQVSHVTVRSVSLQNHDNDPPEKYVRYLARHEYIVGIERTTGQSAPAYALAATTEPPPPAAPPAPAPLVPQPPSSDSDSD